MKLLENGEADVWRSTARRWPPSRGLRRRACTSRTARRERGAAGAAGAPVAGGHGGGRDGRGWSTTSTSTAASTCPSSRSTPSRRRPCSSICGAWAPSTASSSRLHAGAYADGARLLMPASLFGSYSQPTWTTLVAPRAWAEAHRGDLEAFLGVVSAMDDQFLDEAGSRLSRVWRASEKDEHVASVADAHEYLGDGTTRRDPSSYADREATKGLAVDLSTGGAAELRLAAFGAIVRRRYRRHPPSRPRRSRRQRSSPSATGASTGRASSTGPTANATTYDAADLYAAADGAATPRPKTPRSRPALRRAPRRRPSTATGATSRSPGTARHLLRGVPAQRTYGRKGLRVAATGAGRRHCRGRVPDRVWHGDVLLVYGGMSPAGASAPGRLRRGPADLPLPGRHLRRVADAPSASARPPSRRAAPRALGYYSGPRRGTAGRGSRRGGPGRTTAAPRTCGLRRGPRGIRGGRRRLILRGLPGVVATAARNGPSRRPLALALPEAPTASYRNDEACTFAVSAPGSVVVFEATTTSRRPRHAAALRRRGRRGRPAHGHGGDDLAHAVGAEASKVAPADNAGRRLRRLLRRRRLLPARRDLLRPRGLWRRRRLRLRRRLDVAELGMPPCARRTTSRRYGPLGRSLRAGPCRPSPTAGAPSWRRRGTGPCASV